MVAKGNLSTSYMYQLMFYQHIVVAYVENADCERDKPSYMMMDHILTRKCPIFYCPRYRQYSLFVFALVILSGLVNVLSVAEANLRLTSNSFAS